MDEIAKMQVYAVTAAKIWETKKAVTNVAMILVTFQDIIVCDK